MTSSTWHLLLQILFFSGIAFISMLDIAIISLPDSNINTEISEGNYQFILIKKMMQSPNYYSMVIRLATIILFCFATVIFYHSVVLESLRQFVEEHLGLHSFAYNIIMLGTILLYILIIEVFFVKLFKQIGVKFSYTLAKRFSLYLYIVFVIFLPSAKFIENASAFFGKLIKANNLNAKSITEEEIRLMMDIGAEKGTIQNEEKQMIENIFEFNNINANDIMTHRTDVYAVNINDTNDKIIEVIQASGFSRFPVYDDEIDNVVGILSARQFFLNLHNYPQKSLKEIMYAPFIVPETIRADVLFRKMQRNKNHLAVLVDEYGGFNGIVTLEDLLEEIVGNIYDENDFSETKDIIRIHKNLWKISGSTEIERINEALQIQIPTEEDFDTLNGLVFHALSVIPEDGSKFEIELYNLLIQVKKIEDHRILSALVSKKQA